MEYELVAGLETHVQLKTKTKLFCGCSTEFGQPPNTQVCPVCLGLPGVLPVLNKEAFRMAMKIAIALNCTISSMTKFDRKNYFYPDLPKNYQISQYDIPLARDGFVEIRVNNRLKKVRILRVHLEEDAGKLVHQYDRSLVDLNRTGVPLVEIVSMPDINSPEDAYQYLTTLKTIMRYLDVSDCNMEKGEFRCDINLSIRPRGSSKLGVKTEIKNLNSFRFAARAIEFEYNRQVKIIKSGGRIEHETRLYDPEKDQTFLMRSKEEVKDYRYFPEPDLPPFKTDQQLIQEIKTQIPELPIQRQERFMKEYNLSLYDVSILTEESSMANFFEECIKLYNQPKSISNWLINEVLRIVKHKRCEFQDLKLSPDNFVKIVKMCNEKQITTLSAKQVLGEYINTGVPPDQIVSKKGLLQISDEAELDGLVEEIIKENPKAVEDYRKGKTTAIQFLTGQVMRKTRGQANAKIVAKLLQEKLK